MYLGLYVPDEADGLVVIQAYNSTPNILCPCKNKGLISREYYYG